MKLLNFITSSSELQRQLNHSSYNPDTGYATRIVSGDGYHLIPLSI
jgi:hypothetical protein